MSIEVTLKLLNGEKFQVQANPEETIADLKAKVAQARPELPVECQKLIYSGKILADEVTVQESGYQSTGFIVAMATKAKAPAKPPAATPAEAPAATPAPTPTPAVTTPAVPTADAPLNEASVQSLCEMGFPRDQVEAALRASPGQNTMIAVEFLMTGIPEAGGDAEMPAALPFPYGPGPGGPGDGGDEPMPEVLSQLRNNPQFGQLAAMIAQNPQMLDQVLRGVQQTHPEIAQAIQEHPDAFMRLLREATGGALQPEEDDGFVGPGGATREQLAALTAMLQQHPEMLEQLLPDIEAQDPQMAEVIRQNPQRLIDHLARFGQGRGGGAAPGMPGMPGAGGMPGGEVIRLTEEENAAVERLAALGFPKEMAAQAYLACDKSEELAANFLFDNAGN